MFNTMKGFVKQNQPASYTGIFAHTYYWVTSKSGDYVYPNPNFNPLENERCVAIYCTHGTADQPQSFAKIATRLCSVGLPAAVSSIHAIGFDGRYQGKSIEYFAEQLLNKIKENKHTRVLLLGHSRGGLVNAYFAEYLAEKNGINVENVISLGTPFYGSYLAFGPLSWLSTSVKQMEISSVFLDNLIAKIMVSKALYYFVVANDDYIVSSDCSYIPAYVEKNPDSLIKLATTHGHLSMVSSHELVRRIKAILWAFLQPDKNNNIESLASENQAVVDDKEADSLSEKDEEAPEASGLFDIF